MPVNDASELPRTAVLDVVGLTRGLLRRTGDAPNLRRLAEVGGLRAVRPVLPAVTCAAQSTFLTGLPPSGHGIVGNGWYDRTLAEHQFWKQPDHLVQGEKIWETLRRRHGSRFTCAKLFWWYNMYSSVDWSITPRPMYPADGRKVFDIYTDPPDVRGAVTRDLGAFPFPRFWGPGAGLPSSEWIAASARWIEERHRPTLSLIYLPHLDYDLQRYGSEGAGRALREIDTLVGGLASWFADRGVRVVVLSEYGITDVDRPVHLNRVFRERGWFQVREELGLEVPDLGASRVFAIADHQVAHVQVRDPAMRREVHELLERIEGVQSVLDEEGKRRAGLDHPRAGDLVAVADARSWFTYYFWLDDAVAPDYARCVDIHRKIGYDPAELFVDPRLCCPRLGIAWRLLRKRLGFRMLMDVVPLDARLVRGSHGRVPESKDDWPVLIGAGGGKDESDPLEAADVHRVLLDLFPGP